MAETDVAVPLIQLVALFLPAWAVVLQVFTRLIKDTDIREHPLQIPLFSFGFSLSILSLYLFGRAGFEILRYFVEAEIVTGSGPFAQALVQSGSGALAFVSLGAVVLMSIGFRYIPHPEVGYVYGLAVIFSLVMYLGWIFRVVLPMFVVLSLILVASWAVIIHRYTGEDGATEAKA